MPKLEFKTSSTECWSIDGEFYVYAEDRLIRVCPSIGMAHEVAAGY